LLALSRSIHKLIQSNTIWNTCLMYCNFSRWSYQLVSVNNVQHPVLIPAPPTPYSFYPDISEFEWILTIIRVKIGSAKKFSKKRRSPRSKELSRVGISYQRQAARMRKLLGEKLSEENTSVDGISLERSSGERGALDSCLLGDLRSRECVLLNVVVS
jgi:hypothetical protein